MRFNSTIVIILLDNRFWARFTAFSGFRLLCKNHRLYVSFKFQMNGQVLDFYPRQMCAVSIIINISFRFDNNLIFALLSRIIAPSIWISNSKLNVFIYPICNPFSWVAQHFPNRISENIETKNNIGSLKLARQELRLWVSNLLAINNWQNHIILNLPAYNSQDFLGQNSIQILDVRFKVNIKYEAQNQRKYF